MTEQEIRKAALEEAAEICDKLAQQWADANKPKYACLLYAASINIRLRKDENE